jgi:hypothetical protein
MRTIAYWAAGLLAVRLLDGPLAAQNPAPGAGGMDLAGTEYFDRVDQPSGDRYLVVTARSRIRPISHSCISLTHFKKQQDGTGWAPAPCSAR